MIVIMIGWDDFKNLDLELELC